MALSHSPSIVTNGLVLYFDAANLKCFVAGTTTANDITFQGNNGTLFTGATFSNNPGGITQGYTAGMQISPTFSFDGVCGYIDIPNNSFFAGVTTMTIDFWYGQMGSYINSRPLISTAGTDAGIRGFMIRTGLSSTTAPLNFYIRDATSSTSLTFDPTDMRIPNGSDTGTNTYTWNNVIFRAWAAGNSCSIDMKPNGLTTRAVQSAARTGFTSSNPLRLCRGHTGADTSYFGGRNRGIAVLRIYNRLLTEQEMLQNYQATRGRFFK